jgi:uncharacterized protein YhfF
MRRIALITVIVIALLVVMAPDTALAWCNGPARNGIARNGYGSHDWILDHAITLAGASGAWVHRMTALLATDDPDSQHTPAKYHHYFETGTCRGAPYMVAELYHDAIVAYRAGDMAAASKDLGLLSHYYSDILQPFHTTSAANAYEALHSQYERAVDSYQHTFQGASSWITPRPAIAVTDVRAKTVSAALYARSLFPALLASFKASHSVKKGTPLKVTKLVMSRAANDLADIIRGIAEGAGEATAPTTVDMSLSTTSPHQGRKVGAFVTCLDADGEPITAVEVTFVWQLPTGTVTYMTFTDDDGRASRYQDIGASPLMQTAYVTVEITVNGATTTRSCWYQPRS